MTTQPPLNTLDDLRRLALNAGTYGMVTVPARALLDLVGEPPAVENIPSRGELERLIRDAERAASDAADAASDLEDAASELQKVHARMPVPPKLPDTTRKELS